tara:strand:- start:22432 stop:23196 length:765 start_codon:yes stop_codon:yes gene_type:complete
MSHNIRTSGITDIGKTRAQNQDALLIIDSENEKLPDWCELVVAVFDGASGIPNGHIASKRAAQYFADTIKHDSTPVSFTEQIGPVLEEIILKTNKKLVDGARKNDNFYATTIAVVLFNNLDPKIIHCGAVGDSLIYTTTPKGLNRIFDKDSYLNALYKRGFDISKLEANWGKVMTQTLGFNVDIEPHIVDTRISRGQNILLCTDGLTDSLDLPQMEQIIRSHYKNPEQLCENLITIAKQEYGEDDITVVAGYVG